MIETPKTDELLHLLAGVFSEKQFPSIVDHARKLERELAAATEEIRVDEELLAERNRLLAAIPECEIHGACVPHAIEWVERAKTLMKP